MGCRGASEDGPMNDLRTLAAFSHSSCILLEGEETIVIDVSSARGICRGENGMEAQKAKKLVLTEFA